MLERPEAAPLLESVEAIFGQERLAPYLGQWEATRFLQEHKDEIDGLRQSLAAYIDKALDGFGPRAYAKLEQLTADLPDADPRRPAHALPRLPVLGRDDLPGPLAQ